MEIHIYSFNQLIRKLGYAAICIAGLALSNVASAQMSGNYTIDKNSAASSTNFESYTSAVQALRGVTRSDGGPSLGTGVNGAVTITVTQGSGPYQEQVVIPAITGSSSTNRVTFDGNGERIQSSASSSNSSVIQLNGCDYFTFKNLNVKTLSSSYARGFWLKSRADYNIIEDCEIDITSSTSTSSGRSCGIAMVGSSTSFTSYSTGGVKGLNNTFRNNEIYGSTSNNGMYTGIAVNGYTSIQDINLTIEGNYIHNFYYYGIYAYRYMKDVKFTDNVIIRGQKSNNTTFYGIYSYYNAAAKFYGNYIAQDCPVQHTSSAYGIYCYYGSSSNNGSLEFVNNTINLNSGRYKQGIYANEYYANKKKFYHNTIYLHSNQGYGYGIYSYTYNYNTVEYINNIIDIDYNNYYSTTYNIYNYSYGTVTADGNVLPRTNTNNHRTGYLYTISSGGGNATTWSAWQNNPNNPDANGTDVRPTYVDAANGDFEPTTIDIDGAGVAAGVTTDQEGNTRSVTNPDPGAIEFDIPINVSAYTFPSAICQGSTDDVEVTITNSSNLNLSDFYVVYEIDGQIQSTEQFTTTINANSSAQFTFALPIVSTNTGNFTLSAYVRGKPAVVSQAYTVNAAPVGSYVSKGNVFDGSFNSGDAIDPDIVAYGDQIQHVVEAPTGYTHAQYGTDWTFDFWEMVTPGGTSAGSQYSKTNPTGGNAGFNSFTPVIGQSDSTFLIRYAIRSLTNGCIAPIVEREIFVAPRPVAAFVPSVACEGEAVQFDNNSTLSSGTIEYLWDFGDGSTSVLINPDHSYTGPGTYTAKVTATTNYGYSNSATTSVTVKENPTAEFGATNVCEGTATPFTDGSIVPVGTPSYEWNFGDGSAMGTGANPSHQYAATGSYEVSMKITADGCSDEVTNYVTYAPRATVDFTPSATTCNSEEVSFTNASNLVEGQMGYTWDFGDTKTSTEMEPFHEYDIFGTIDVTLTVTTDFGCTDMLTKQITLTESPKASFTTSTLCDKEDVNFTNASTEPAGASTTYEWSFSDGSSYTTNDVMRSFPSIGEYDVTLLAFADNGCQDEMTMTISVDEMPAAEFYANEVCEGTDMELMNASNGNMGNFTNSWDFGAAGTSTDMNPTVTLPVGSTDVTLVVSTPSGCETTVTKTVMVNANPTISNVVITSGVKGDGTYVFTADVTPADAKYVLFWGDGGRADATASNGSITETYTYLTDGLFDVSVRLENANCSIEADGNANVTRTGLLNIANGSLIVYPNPSNGVFNIDLSSLNTENIQIDVYAANGQLINANANITGQAAQLDLSTAAAGVYLVKVRTESGIHTARITLNK